MSGFDPWRVVKNRKQLFMLREAEIKHARIAMLAAVGWPASELCHYTFAKMFGTYVHTYIYTYIHTYKHTYTHTYMHAYIHTYINTYIHL